MSYLKHDIFISSLKIIGTLEATSRLHIGGGKDAGGFEEVDSPLIRVNFEGMDLPFIPGSTLKGIFRSTVENIFKSCGEYICEPYNRNSKCYEAGERILFANKSNDPIRLIEAIQGLCLACKMFGGPNFNSHVIMSESIPIDGNSVAFDISPGIAINRRNGTAMRGGLFTLEHINPESKFNFQIQVNNLPNYLIGVLFMVIMLINKKLVLIGGNKRAGLGRVLITIKKIDFKTIEKTISINYDSLNTSSIEKYVIDKMDYPEISDYDIVIPLNELKGKSKNEFTKILINYFKEAWLTHVGSKKNWANHERTI